LGIVSLDRFTHTGCGRRIGRAAAPLTLVAAASGMALCPNVAKRQRAAASGAARRDSREPRICAEAQLHCKAPERKVPESSWS